MDEVEWTIELSHRAENNIDKILLYISQNSSLQKAQSFLKGFYEALEDLKRFPRMYAKLPDLEDPNIRNFIYSTILTFSGIIFFKIASNFSYSSI